MSGVRIDVRHAAGEFALEARFETPEQGIAVLFGPSGAGKSLTLSLVAGLICPDEGRIEIRGRTVDDVASGLHVPARDRHVGMVFQESLLLPHRTALDNVALAVRHRRRPERREKARELLDEVGAGRLAGARPKTLSGGERQRVAFARALAGSPELLLLDEPFSALDQPVRVELRALVRSIVTERGIPALFVTHDREEAAELADRLIPFEVGRAVDGAEAAGAGSSGLNTLRS